MSAPRSQRLLPIVACAALLVAALPALLLAAPPAPADGAAATAGDVAAAVNRAIDYLQTKGQAADGSFSAKADPAITALAATAMLRNGRTADDPSVAKALKYLQSYVHDDGGIYAAGSTHQNYETCVAIQCFTAANRDKRYDKLLERATAFAKDLQWDGKEGIDKSNPFFGGAGYGGSKRPDLSNTSFLMDVLKQSGAGPDDPAVKDALVFVSRCQNLETENNTTPFAAKNPDGGFYYTPAAGGASFAGKTPDGGLRSYGSMTYAGLKCMIFAGVGPDDPRVKSAFKWIQQHYTLDENPGMGGSGLYYYYHTFAKALDALGHDEIEDSDGKSHKWREELASALVKRQRPDGSWVNEDRRWMEGDANLVTSYVLLTLAHCKPHKTAGGK